MKKLIITITAIILLSISSTFAFAELTKEVVVDKMEVLENGTIQVRQAIRVLENGKVISQKFHRYVVVPGDDVTTKETKVKNLANSIWTQDVIDNYLVSIGEEVQTLDQQKKVKVKTFRKNIKEFTNTLPDGDPRYDADLKLGLMNAIMAYTIAGQPVPEGLANAKTWLMTVQGLFVSKKAAIKAVETQEALDAITITIADLESKYGREGTVLADPGISTADLM
jgi:hypothetical protein